MLLRLEAQYGLCRATESIQEVIRALNLTMRDVEEEWRIWRHEYVSATLRSGISLPFSYDDIVEPLRQALYTSNHAFVPHVGDAIKVAPRLPSWDTTPCILRSGTRGPPPPTPNPGVGSRTEGL